MLPPRAYAEPLPSFSANLRAHPEPTDSRQPVIVAASAPDIEKFPTVPYARHAARTTTEAIRLIERLRPRVIAIDWELAELDTNALCDLARRIAPVGVLALMGSPERAPAALKAGCHSILLKPLVTSLVAARLGRLCREMPTAVAARDPGIRRQWGTNRTWSHLHCPRCNESGAVGFEHSSHRRSWYACLSCEHVWLGSRRE